MLVTSWVCVPTHTPQEMTKRMMMEEQKKVNSQNFDKVLHHADEVTRRENDYRYERTRLWISSAVRCFQNNAVAQVFYKVRTQPSPRPGPVLWWNVVWQVRHSVDIGPACIWRGQFSGVTSSACLYIVVPSAPEGRRWYRALLFLSPQT